MTKATDLIAAKRDRQINTHNHTAEDDKGRELDLIAAANCYIQYWVLRQQFPEEPETSFGHPADQMPNGIPIWPWHRNYWKPTTFEDDMVLAAALLAAAVDSKLHTKVVEGLRGEEGPTS